MPFSIPLRRSFWLLLIVCGQAVAPLAAGPRLLRVHLDLDAVVLLDLEPGPLGIFALPPPAGEEEMTSGEATQVGEIHFRDSEANYEVLVDEATPEDTVFQVRSTGHPLEGSTFLLEPNAPATTGSALDPSAETAASAAPNHPRRSRRVRVAVAKTKEETSHEASPTREKTRPSRPRPAAATATAKKTASSARPSSYLLVSEQELHKAAQTQPGSDGKWTCPICAHASLGAGTFAVHLKAHSSLKDHVCPMCEQRFRQSSNLNVHIRRHHEHTSDHGCPKCAHQPASRFDLEVHFLRVHTSLRPLACAHCGWRTADPSNLRQHHQGKHPLEPMPSIDKGPIRVAAAQALKAFRAEAEGDEQQAAAAASSAKALEAAPGQASRRRGHKWSVSMATSSTQAASGQKRPERPKNRPTALAEARVRPAVAPAPSDAAPVPLAPALAPSTPSRPAQTVVPVPPNVMLAVPRVEMPVQAVRLPTPAIVRLPTPNPVVATAAPTQAMPALVVLSRALIRQSQGQVPTPAIALPTRAYLVPPPPRAAPASALLAAAAGHVEPSPSAAQDARPWSGSSQPGEASQPPKFVSPSVYLSAEVLQRPSPSISVPPSMAVHAPLFPAVGGHLLSPPSSAQVFPPRFASPMVFPLREFMEPSLTSPARTGPLFVSPFRTPSNLVDDFDRSGPTGRERSGLLTEALPPIPNLPTFTSSW